MKLLLKYFRLIISLFIFLNLDIGNQLKDETEKIEDPGIYDSLTKKRKRIPKKKTSSSDQDDKSIELTEGLIFYEPFIYDNGALGGKSNDDTGLDQPWNGWHVLIDSKAGLTFPGIGGKGAGAISEDTGDKVFNNGSVRLPLEEPLTRDVYITFLTVIGQEDGESIIRLYNNGKSSKIDTVQIGLDKSGIPSVKSWHANEFQDNIVSGGKKRLNKKDTHLICIHVDFDAKGTEDEIKMWVDPDGIPEGKPGLTHKLPGDYSGIIDTLTIAMGYNQSKSTIIDEIRMGYNWETVLPGYKKGALAQKKTKTGKKEGLIFYEPFDFDEGEISSKKNDDTGLTVAWQGESVTLETKSGLTHPKINGKGTGLRSVDTGNNTYHYAFTGLPLDEPLSDDVYFSFMVKQGNDGGTPYIRLYPRSTGGKEDTFQIGINKDSEFFIDSWHSDEFKDKVSTVGNKTGPSEAHLICFKIDFDAEEKKDVIKAWIDPDGMPGDLRPDIIHEFPTDMSGLIDTIQLAMGFNQNNTAVIDEIRMGYDWKSVLPGLGK